MNELQRQQYLEALGVDSYMPRWVLPLAPEPRRCAAPLAASIRASVPEPAALEAPVSESVAVDSVCEIMPDVAEPRAPATPAQPSGSVEAAQPTIQLLDEPAESSPVALPAAKTDAAVTPDVSFALGAWRISDDLLVVDSRKAELALPVDALLVNMLSALGYPPAALPKVEVVRWPREESAFHDRSEVAARAMSQAWLNARLETHPVKFLLLLGTEACHYLLPQEQAPAGQAPQQSLEALSGKAVRLDALNCSAIVVPSLVDILQRPALKAQVWQALQPLRLQ